jgi:uncharacterized protein YegP (UPF0339 family)
MIDGMPQDELAEIDLTEDEIDAMMAEGEPVEITGPPDSERRVEVEVVKSDAESYFWRIVDATGAILATSDGHYRSVGATLRAIAAIKHALAEARVRNVTDHV